jgi:hypothetical protein
VLDLGGEEESQEIRHVRWLDPHLEDCHSGLVGSGAIEEIKVKDKARLEEGVEKRDRVEVLRESEDAGAVYLGTGLLVYRPMYAGLKKGEMGKFMTRATHQYFFWH